jgi:hypothetical protein
LAKLQAFPVPAGKPVKVRMADECRIGLHTPPLVTARPAFVIKENGIRIKTEPPAPGRFFGAQTSQVQMPVSFAGQGFFRGAKLC